MSKKVAKKVATKKEVVVNDKYDAKELDSLETKSAKIRYLDSKGLSRSSIVKVLNEKYDYNIIYQHVRNVLITPLKRELKK